MGFGIGRAFKSAVKSVGKALRGTIKGVANPVLGLVGVKKPEMEEAPIPEPPAVNVAPPTSGEVEKEITEDTESARKKASARGKRGLQVTRKSGQGINI